MPARLDPSSHAHALARFAPRTRLIALVALLALGCDERPAAPSSTPAPAEGRQLDPEPALPSAAPSALCLRLEEERTALNLGAPLVARVTSFEERARAWLEQDRPGSALAAALADVLANPHDLDALQALQQAPRALDEAPELRVDATLVALRALDAAAPGGSNEALLALLAQARAWHPHDPAIPWLTALLLPELGGRRARLEEAFALGARDPALTLALARARMRDGDAEGTLAALDSLPASPTPTDAPPPVTIDAPAITAPALPPAATDPRAAAPSALSLGAALREQALRAREAMAARQAHELDGVRVWAPARTPDELAAQLTRALRADLDEAATLLGGDARAALVVWVYESDDELAAATCGASWSQAIYDGALHVVLPGLVFDDALRTSVRHEAFHAQLDTMTPLAPRWLHEGGAQRFAREPVDRDALRGASVTSASALRDLDVLLAPGRSGADAGRAYALARVTVDELLAREGDAALARAVAALRAGVPPQELPARLGFALP